MSMATKKAIKLKYSLVPNTLPRSAGYHRSLTHIDSRDGDSFFEDVASNLPGQTSVGAELVWNLMVEAIAENLAKYQYRVSVNGNTFELAIPGSTESVNGTPSEGVYVSVSPSTALRGAVADITPTYSDSEADAPALKQVVKQQSNVSDQIVVMESFRLVGNNITAEGDDETITVVAADGTEATAVVDSEDGAGMFITAHLAAPLPPGKGKVVLTTHGKRTPEGELRTLVKSVTILAGEGPVGPAPTITGAKTRGESEGSVNIAGGILDVVGANLETATAVELHSDTQPTGEASLWQTLPATYADGKLTTGELDFDEKPSDGGFVRVATAGGSAMFPVTYCAH